MPDGLKNPLGFPPPHRSCARPLCCENANVVHPFASPLFGSGDNLWKSNQNQPQRSGQARAYRRLEITKNERLHGGGLYRWNPAWAKTTRKIARVFSFARVFDGNGWARGKNRKDLSIQSDYLEYVSFDLFRFGHGWVQKNIDGHISFPFFVSFLQ